jgi:hypothetical protein
MKRDRPEVAVMLFFFVVKDDSSLTVTNDVIISVSFISHFRSLPSVSVPSWHPLKVVWNPFILPNHRDLARVRSSPFAPFTSQPYSSSR